MLRTAGKKVFARLMPFLFIMQGLLNGGFYLAWQ